MRNNNQKGLLLSQACSYNKLPLLSFSRYLPFNCLKLSGNNPKIRYPLLFQVEKLQEAIGATEKAGGVLCERKNEAVREINAVFEDLFSKLKSRKQQLLDDVESHYNTKVEQIRKLNKKLYILFQCVRHRSSSWHCCDCA